MIEIFNSMTLSDQKQMEATYDIWRILCPTGGFEQREKLNVEFHYVILRAE